MVAVTDFGGYPNPNDFSSQVTCFMVPSLSVDRYVSIDTAANIVTNNVTSVTNNLISGDIYGAGTMVTFRVAFDYNVTVINASGISLQTTILSANSLFMKAFLDIPAGPISILSFTYITAPGDSATNVSYTGTGALSVASNASIVDYFGRPVNTTLPVPENQTYASINTTAPQIVSITTPTPDGLYGVGEFILILVTYSVPVVVTGVPYFQLSNFIISNAPFGGMINSTTLAFTLNILPNENSTELSFAPPTVLLLPGENATIQCASDFPVVNASTSLSTMVFSSFLLLHHIFINSTAPSIDASFGLQSNKSSGVYFAGEDITFCIQFTSPIAVFGSSITLSLNCGLASPCYAKVSSLRPSPLNLCFYFQIPSLANTSNLSIYSESSLFVGPEDFIRRAATNPIQAANLSMIGLLSSSIPFGMNGFPATVTNISILNLASGGILQPDDVLLLQITFSSNVTFTCSPVLQLNFGNDFLYQASYISGRGSNAFIFEYTVNMGDGGNGLSFLRNSLCADTSCSQYSPCAILTLSSHPFLPINPNLPNGIFFNLSINPFSVTRNTSLINITTSHALGNIHAGEEVFYTALFTDAVYLNISSAAVHPSLYLSTNRSAVYFGGSGTKALLFLYIVQTIDPSGELYPALIQGSNVSIQCLLVESCYIQNVLGGGADLASFFLLTSSGIFIDNAPPQIDDLFLYTGISNQSTFTAGDTVYIGMSFDQRVQTVLPGPWLAIDLNRDTSIIRYALFNGGLSNDSTLIFSLLIEPLDASSALQCLNSFALNYLQSAFPIYAASSHPMTEINYTLPFLQISSSNSGAAGVAVVDGIIIPAVSNVQALTPDGMYAVGDVIIIQVTFSMQVVTNGASFLYLKVGSRLAKSVFIGTNPATIITDPRGYTFPSYNLLYAYTVEEGDTSSQLEYADVYSLQLFANQTTTLGRPFIRRQASIPTLDANLQLPSPGSFGSISSTSNIKIDGSVPFVTSLFVLNQDGLYGLLDTIFIVMEFSRPVIVLYGSPSFRLNTNLFNFAQYINGSETSSLLFQYNPQPGDSAPYFDYFGDTDAFQSPAMSFFYNNASIFSLSSNPTLPADIHLNPLRGKLLGSFSATAQAGLASFNDLGIDSPGKDYRIYFLLNNNYSSYVYQNLSVEFSIEFELRPPLAQPLDMVGFSVSISGQTAVMGAPNTKLAAGETSEVQAVTTSSSPIPLPLPDIQLVETRIVPQPSIQRFYSTADVGASIGGYFRILQGFLGPSRPIPYNADPSMIAAFLAFDMPELGKVIVTKEAYTFCACENAYTWTITFTELTTGVVLPITLDAELLIGVGATIIGPEILQEAALLQGFFTLSALYQISPAIPYDAGVADMTNAINSLGFNVTSIFITSSDPGGARGWIITFANYPGYIPTLQGNSAGLSGAYVTSVWTEKLQNASYSSLSGGFTLTWRGNTTSLIPYDASASFVAAALEALPVIGEVNVQRCCQSNVNGYTWTVHHFFFPYLMNC